MSDMSDEVWGIPYWDETGDEWKPDPEGVRNLHNQFNELFKKLDNKNVSGMRRVRIGYPGLVDPVSAYQNGLLDAVNGRVNLSPVLIASEQRVLNDRYCEGYAAGSNLMGRLSVEELEAIVLGKIDKLNRKRRNRK